MEVGERDVARPVVKANTTSAADRQDDEQAQHGREQRHHRAGDVEAGAGGAAMGAGSASVVMTHRLVVGSARIPRCRLPL